MIYYIRATEQDWPLVESLAIALGIAQRTESGLVGQGWVYIGPVYKPTGETATVDDITVELTAPVRDLGGNLFLHANVVMDGSLRELAESKAATNPELAEALSMIPRYFVTDELGSPVAPRNPARVIF
jgi:hypothetical protein